MTKINTDRLIFFFFVIIPATCLLMDYKKFPDCFCKCLIQITQVENRSFPKNSGMTLEMNKCFLSGKLSHVLIYWFIG